MKTINKHILVILISLLVSTAAGAATKHHARAARIVGQLTAKLPAAHKVSAQPTKATAAYALIPEQQKNIAGFTHEIGNNTDTFVELVAREFALEKTHYTFVHGFRKDHCIVQDFLKALYEWEFGVQLPQDFIFLRWWHDASSYPDITSFLKSEFQNYLDKNCKGSLGVYYNNWYRTDSDKPDITRNLSAALRDHRILLAYNAFDHQPSIAKQLLAVNLCPFGSSNFKGSSAESSVEFFWGKFIRGSEAATILEPIFKYYGFDLKHINDLTDLVQMLGTQDRRIRSAHPSQALMQICVPKNLADASLAITFSLGAPAHALKAPDHSIIAEKDYNSTSSYYEKSSGLLETYCNNPELFPFIASAKVPKQDLLQGRLLLNKEYALNPESGFKMFRYIGKGPDKPIMTEHELQPYYKQLHAMCQTIFATAAKKQTWQQRRIIQETPVAITQYHRNAALDLFKPMLVEWKLYNAIENGNLDEIKKLIQQNNIDIRTYTYKNYDAYKHLIDHAVACADRSTSIVQWLLDQGAQPNIHMLISASQAGKWDLVKCLIEHGIPHLKSIFSYYNESPLYQAAIADREDMIILLLAHGAHKLTPLQFETALNNGNHFYRLKKYRTLIVQG